MNPYEALAVARDLAVLPEIDKDAVYHAAARATGLLMAVAFIVRNSHPSLAADAGEIAGLLRKALFPKAVTE